MKQRIFYVLFACTVLSSCVKQTKLFNGKNLKGWYAYTDIDKKRVPPESNFVVSDGLIRLYGDKLGYLMTEQSYQNFELTLDFRWNIDKRYFRNNNVKNSGVMYHIPENVPDVLWPRGIQFQIKQGSTGDFVLLDSLTLTVRGVTNPAGKSVVVARERDNEKSTGEWNTIKIVSQNGDCWQYLNGILINSGTNASVKKGRILLQYEGVPIDFRNILLKKR
ncbi:MAG: DUF1080 domain-containing protein [Spirosomataceae bacterium]